MLLSDEENTSEYSQPPSSQHSTLESNPEASLQQLKRMADKQQNTVPNLPAESDSESEAEFGDNINGNSDMAPVEPEVVKAAA